MYCTRCLEIKFAITYDSKLACIERALLDRLVLDQSLGQVGKGRERKREKEKKIDDECCTLTHGEPPRLRRRVMLPNSLPIHLQLLDDLRLDRQNRIALASLPPSPSSLSQLPIQTPPKASNRNPGRSASLVSSAQSTYSQSETPWVRGSPPCRPYPPPATKLKFTSIRNNSDSALWC